MQNPFRNTYPSNIHQRDDTRSVETSRRHAIEKRDNCLERVHELERKLNVMQRWEPGSREWIAASERVKLHEYRKAIDSLESLIVAWLFELSNMNKSQICKYHYYISRSYDSCVLSGYKLRDHISNSMKSRSKAIKTALERYNKAAATCSLRAPPLTWKEVVDCAILADFDFLRDVRQDVRSKPWASPTNRLLRDQYFKLERAREEIERLNIEIQRVITHIVNETAFLLATENSVAQNDPWLAHQIGLYRLERGRADVIHVKRFRKLAAEPGFTGQVKPGRSINLPAANAESHFSLPEDISGGETEEEDEYDEVEDEQEALDIALKVLTITSDDRSAMELVTGNE